MEYEALVKLWAAAPGRFRVERAVTSGPESEPYTRVLDGADEWYYAPSSGIYKNPSGGEYVECSILLDPAPLISALAFRNVVDASVLGRNVVHAHATLRSPKRHPPEELQELGLGADHYELTVDRERGVLLRFAALLGDALMFSLTVEELAFDEELAANLFELNAPADVPVIDAAAIRPPKSMRLEEAAREASFTVLIPARAPESTSLHVSYQEGSETPRLLEQVYVSYVFPTGAHSLVIVEAAASEPAGDPSGAEWTVMARDGAALRHRDHGAQRDIELEREGTRVRLSSDLELETLVELALSLVPAPTEPPRLVGS